MPRPASLPPRDTQVRMPGEDEGEPVRPEEVRRRNLRDVGMLVLGIASLAIVAYDFFFRATLTRAQIAVLEWVDLAIVLVFVAEFAVRWREVRWRPRFVLENWFDVLGLVPLMATNFPLFRAFRLLRVGVIAARLVRMWSFFTGEKSAQLVLGRYKGIIAEEVSDLVMLRILAMAEDVAARGGYPRAVGESLAAQREDIGAMAVEAARAGAPSPWVAQLPGFEPLVRTTAQAISDAAAAALRSEEMQRTFEAAVRNVVAEMRKEIARKEWKDRALQSPW